ncbi:MAG: hypothetical protein R3F20_02810 [Planctomycetota bacterium]
MTCFFLASTPGLKSGRTREDVADRQISRRRDFALADIRNVRSETSPTGRVPAPPVPDSRDEDR